MKLEAIELRAQAIKEIRRFFDEMGFLEVETPVRIKAPAPEPHIDCPPVSTGGFLRASPELQMKKLLAAGLDKIYQIGPCFRDGEIGSRHNSEFTMLEWYRSRATYLDIKEDFRRMFIMLKEKFSSRAKKEQCKIEEIPVRRAYIEFASWDPWEGEWNQDKFDYDMATIIEPELKRHEGVILVDYPKPCASLAKISGDVAQRWEFYWRGVELANCFTELCDSAEQARRFEEARKERKALDESPYPIDSNFLTEIAKIESAAGIAVGIDRLIMVLGDLSEISQARVMD